MESSKSGILAAITAFSLWGVLPIFWKFLGFLPPATIVAQRTLWSFVLLVILLIWRGEIRALFAGLRTPRAIAWHFLSGGLLATNWLLYVWATLNDRIIESALGYYLNPFLNMLFGVIWFGETHNRWQQTAIAVALGGVVLQFPTAGRLPWVALVLALTFSLYAVVRKRAPLGSLVGLTAETSLLAPVALVGLCIIHTEPVDAFGSSWHRASLVVATGLATALPLLSFGHATKTISLTTLGILQFLAPTIQLFIGWKIYNEAMSVERIVSFSLIWTAIAIYATDSIRRRKIALG